MRVFRGGEVIEQIDNQNPRVVVSLPSTGSYVIEVVHSGTNVSDQLRLTVEG